MTANQLLNKCSTHYYYAGGNILVSLGVLAGFVQVGILPKTTDSWGFLFPVILGHYSFQYYIIGVNQGYDIGKHHGRKEMMAEDILRLRSKND